jgi:type IV secretory pathway VirB3-like protein
LDGKVIDATWSMILGVENELGVMNVGSEKITTAITNKFIIVVVNILMFTNIRQ